MPEVRFAVIVELEIAEPDLSSFLDLVFANAAASVEDESGCLCFDVLLPERADDQPSVLLYEIYASSAAFERHLVTSHFLMFEDATKSIVKSKQIRTYRATISER